MDPKFIQGEVQVRKKKRQPGDKGIYHGLKKPSINFVRSLPTSPRAIKPSVPKQYHPVKVNSSTNINETFTMSRFEGNNDLQDFEISIEDPLEMQLTTARKEERPQSKGFTQHVNSTALKILHRRMYMKNKMRS